MYLRMNGGKWGSFKFSFFYTEFPHDYSFEDRTIYTDPGSQDLTLPGRASATPKNSDLWPSTSFDYKIERKDVGGAVDVTALSPFFFNVTANHLERQGDMPWSGHSVVRVREHRGAASPYRRPHDQHERPSGLEEQAVLRGLRRGLQRVRRFGGVHPLSGPLRHGRDRLRHHRRPPRQQVMERQFQRHREAPLLLEACLERELSRKTRPHSTLVNPVEDRHRGRPRPP